jgi:hypothetical protein
MSPGPRALGEDTGGAGGVGDSRSPHGRWEARPETQRPNPDDPCPLQLGATPSSPQNLPKTAPDFASLLQGRLHMADT